MRLVLPGRTTVEGAVARLLLAEARDPGNAFYNAVDTLQSMQWMKVVLNNRLTHHPAQFMAPHARTLTDIIKAPGQFAGFSGYPNYDEELAARLQSIIDIANHATDRRSAAYRVFVQNALDVAQAPPVADPAIAANPQSAGLFGWKSTGAAPPGGRFSVFRNLAGNTFYTLTA